MESYLFRCLLKAFSIIVCLISLPFLGTGQVFAGTFELRFGPSLSSFRLTGTDSGGRKASISTELGIGGSLAFGYRVLGEAVYFGLLGAVEKVSLGASYTGSLGTSQLLFVGGGAELRIDFIRTSFHFQYEKASRAIFDPSSSEALAVSPVLVDVITGGLTVRPLVSRQSRIELIGSGCYIGGSDKTSRGSRVVSGYGLSGGGGVEFGPLTRIRFDALVQWTQINSTPIGVSGLEFRFGIQLTIPFKKRFPPYAQDLL